MDDRSSNDFYDDPSFGSAPPAGTVGKDLIMTIVHTNGIHYLPVFRCLCPSERKDVDLLKMGLYPVTSEETNTAFTFQQLREFHFSKIHAHVSAETYTQILSRMTNYIFPDEVPDRTRELTRAWQQWNYLTELKRKGFGVHEPLRKPKRSELATFCPVCPQPGINLPADWKSDKLGWKYWRYLTADGNFVLNHLEIQGEEKIVWLTDGAGYVVENEKLAQHLKGTKEVYQEPTCLQHRATADKNKEKKGYDCSGFVAIACARHGCFAPGSGVDLQKGERYVRLLHWHGRDAIRPSLQLKDTVTHARSRQLNIDLALSEASITTEAGKTPGTRFAYDVNCQYCVNFRERVANGNYPGLPSTMEMQFLIGLFHVHGHKSECLSRYAPTFSPGAAVASGEILESLWSTMNGVADMTRQMTLAHRAETLDASMRDSNWRKLQGMVEYLNDQHELATNMAKASAEDFNNLDSTVTADQRRRWQKQMVKANKRRSKDVTAMDKYNAVVIPVEGKAETQARLMGLARKGKRSPATVKWVARGIELQETQIQVRSFISGGVKAFKTPKGNPEVKFALEVEKKRETLVTQIADLTGQASKLWRGVKLPKKNRKSPIDRNFCICEEDCSCDHPALPPKESSEEDEENIILPLPSSFDDLPEGWEGVAEAEVELRVSQANEALQGVRMDIARKSFEYRKRHRKLTEGQEGRTRSYAAINEIGRSLRLHLKHYDLAVWALKRLKALQDHPEFEEITPADTKAISAVYDPNARDKREEELSWIWKVKGSRRTSGYVEELYRVSWIRACSRRDRWAEELIMVESEMEWFVRFASYSSDRAMGWAPNALSPGHKAYALRQADMWRRVGRNAKALFFDVSKVKVPADLV